MAFLRYMEDTNGKVDARNRNIATTANGREQFLG